MHESLHPDNTSEPTYKMTREQLQEDDIRWVMGLQLNGAIETDEAAIAELEAMLDEDDGVLA